MSAQGGPVSAVTRAIDAEALRAVGFWEAIRFWLKLGFVGFGRPAGQIAIIQGSGKGGVWTTADSVALFDAFAYGGNRP